MSDDTGDRRPTYHRPPDDPTRTEQGYFDPASPPFTRRYGFGAGGYYNLRGDWQVAGPFTGVGPKGYQRSDERIEEDVCERLKQHGHLDASDIDVRVEAGEVILEGRVDTRLAKRMAEDTAATVMGVRDVRNRLRVRWLDRDQSESRT